MRIAVVGAGALGAIYALKLAHVSPVTLIVRDLSRAPKQILAEHATGKGPTLDALAPEAALEVPDDVDAVIVTVRVDQLDDALLAKLAHGGPAHRIVVMLTPLLPQLYDHVLEKLGARLVVGMPGVVAYEPDGDTGAGARHYRYWTPRASPTAFDAVADEQHLSVVKDLAQTLVAAGLPCDVTPHVATINPATTIAFFPLMLGIQASGGSIQALLDDGKLLRLILDAGKETRALAKTVGDLASFASLLLSFAGPFTVRAGVKLARARSPESLVFLEKHFGQKLKAQNAMMLRSIEELARARGASIDALVQLGTQAGLSS